MNRTTYGLDIAKNVMQLHWVEIETGEIGRKKARVGHLSKRGDPYLRTLLIHGARAVIEHAKDKPKWLEQVLARRPLNVAGGGPVHHNGPPGPVPGWHQAAEPTDL